jgi:hypothetical protein
LLFVVVFLLNAFFAYYKIGRASINNDAHFWYTRTQNFVNALQTGRLNETYQNAKPGVSVMWLSGLSLETFLNLYEKVFHFRPLIWTHDTFYLVHFSIIAPLVTVGLVSVLLLYFLGQKFMDKRVLALGIMLLVLQPFYVGISRNFHSDHVLMAFMLMSVVLWIYYLRVSKRFVFAILSGIAAGMAFLSKSAAIFLIPYIGFVLFVDYLFYQGKIFKYAKDYLVWFLSCAAAFFALFPATWLKPIEILRRIFIYEGVYLATIGRDGVNPFWYYAEPVVRILTPVFLIAFILGVLFVIGNLRDYERKKRYNVVLIFGFVFFFFLQMSLVKQKMDRYLLPAFPFMALMGGYGLVHLIEWIKGLFLKNKFVVEKLLVALFLIANLSYILYYFPNYLIYPSFPGKDQFGCSLCSDIGDYFNSQPNGAALKIVSLSKKLHRLRPFVKGKVYSTEEEIPGTWTADYVVAAKHETLPEAYSHCWLETIIVFRNVDYWDIYRCK